MALVPSISQLCKPYLFPFIVVDLWIFCQVADSLKDSCLASIHPTDDENSKLFKFLHEGQIDMLHDVGDVPSVHLQIGNAQVIRAWVERDRT